MLTRLRPQGMMSQQNAAFALLRLLRCAPPDAPSVSFLECRTCCGIVLGSPTVDSATPPFDPMLRAAVEGVLAELPAGTEPRL